MPLLLRYVMRCYTICQDSTTQDTVVAKMMPKTCPIIMRKEWQDSSCAAQSVLPEVLQAVMGMLLVAFATVG